MVYDTTPENRVTLNAAGEAIMRRSQPYCRGDEEDAFASAEDYEAESGKKGKKFNLQD